MKRMGGLDGSVGVPGDKSISHRSVLLASLAVGKSVYRQPVEGGNFMGLVKAESQLLADLCKGLAEEFRKIR